MSNSKKLLFIGNKDSDLEILATEMGYRTQCLAVDAIANGELPQDLDGIFLLADMQPLPRIYPAPLLGALRRLMDDGLRVFAEYTILFVRPDGIRFEILDAQRLIVRENGVLTDSFTPGALLDPHQSWLLTSGMPGGFQAVADEGEGFERFVEADISCLSLFDLAGTIGVDQLIGEPISEPRPVIFSVNENRRKWIVSQIRLSEYQKDLFSPSNTWQRLAVNLIRYISGDSTDAAYFNGTTSQVVLPRQGWSAQSVATEKTTEPAQDKIEQATLSLGQWFLNSGIMPDPQGCNGISERFMTETYPGGRQMIDPAVRTDCTFQTALFFDGLQKTGISQGGKIASNLVDSLVRNNYQDLDTSRPTNGFWHWGRGDFGRPYSTDEFPQDIYANDSCWAVFSLLQIEPTHLPDDWSRRLQLTGNAYLETQGKDGLRQWMIPGKELVKNGREYYQGLTTAKPSGHFDGMALPALIATALATGENKYMDKARQGVRTLAQFALDDKMHDVPISQTADNASRLAVFALGALHCDDELCRMALEKTVAYLLEHQHECGGIYEAGNPIKNMSQRSGDVGVFIKEDDLICDLMYCNSFSALFLPMAAEVLRSSEVRDASLRLLNFLADIQIVSKQRELNGCYKRAFSIKEWDYHGYNADYKWGPTVIESGWSNALIGLAFCRHLLNSPFLSKVNQIKKY